MRNISLRSSTCPPPIQMALLHAALLQSAAAVEAWQTWRTQVDIDLDQLDGGSFRLLPLVYHNLQRYTLADPLLPRLKGIYRRTWSQNQLLLPAATAVLVALETDNVPTMLLPGTTVTYRYHSDAGLRPLECFDLLVSATQATRAMDCLAKLGWQSAIAHFSTGKVATTYTRRLQNAQGQRLDLYWCDDPFTADPAPMWSSIVTTLGKATTRILNPTALLFHLCTHGARWEMAPTTIDWVADALMVLRSPTTIIEWSLLLQQAVEQQVGLRLCTSLAYLAATFPTVIPSTVQKCITTLPASTAERLEEGILRQAPKRLQKIPRAWLHYWRHQQQLGKSGWQLFNPHHLQHYIQQKRNES